VTGAEGSAISVPRYHEAVDASAVEARLKAFFEEDPRGAVAVYLFGSVARGDARSDSDVDVGVLFAAEPPATLSAPQFALEAALERLLVRPVQVVALNRASADLVHRVLRDGHLVLDRDRAARIRFEVRSRNEYFDMAPIRRLYRGYPAPGASLGRVAEPRR
jgi:predicted nucleotidyltransferase